MQKYGRERSRVHYGSAIELQYKLSTYGIPQDTFPIDVSGNLRKGFHTNAWFYDSLIKEEGNTLHLIRNDNYSLSADEESIESLSTSAGESGGDDDGAIISMESSTENQESEIDSLRPYTDQDVLLGKGFVVQNHPGNIAFREFLEEYYEEYDNAQRSSRVDIARRLTRTLRASGVQFWKEIEYTVWTETSFDEAVKKVGQVFRSARKRRNR